MTPRQYQIRASMTGALAAQVGDTSLREAIRAKVVDLAAAQGRPLESARVGGIVSATLTAAARTILFAAEIPVALEMGSAGELAHEGTSVTQTNCAAWVSAYAASGDRRAVQEQISIDAARDRKRMDSVAADELRRDYDAGGLRRAWDVFVSEGTWIFREGYGAALYAKIGPAAIRALLGPDRIAAAKIDAVNGIRHDYARTRRSAPTEEIEADPLFTMYWKARLVRAYFETLRDRSLDIDYNPAAV